MVLESFLFLARLCSLGFIGLVWPVAGIALLVLLKNPNPHRNNDKASPADGRHLLCYAPCLV